MSWFHWPKWISSAFVSRREVIRHLVTLPPAFSILPLSLAGRPEPHEHVLGMAAQHPCPNTWTVVGEMTVNGKKMCVYRAADGGIHAVACSD